MNQLKSGTLLVIVATVIISILILTTSINSSLPTAPAVAKVTDEVINAEANSAESVTEIVKVAETTELKNPDKTMPEEIKQEADKIVEESNAEVAKADEVDENNSESKTEEAVNIVVETEPVEIKAPEGLYNSSVDESGNKNVSGETKEQAETEVSENKETEGSIKPESIKAMATSTQHDLLNHLIQPIWMDQKLGDFKSVEKGEVEFKLMPVTAEGIQGEDPKQVVTNDNDKFAPTTVSADYNYQQMPMYNGGYFIAPMPQYLMDSVLPASSQNKD